MALRRRALVVVLAIGAALLAAGCSPTANPSSPTNRSNPPGSSGAVFHAAADLEAKLPAQAGSIAIGRESVLGTGFKAVRQNDAGLRCRWYVGRGLRCRDEALLTAVLGRLSKSARDVSIAVGYDRSHAKPIELQALRIAGVTGRQILDAVLAVEAARRSAAPAPTRLQLGGREVVVLQPGRPYPSRTRYRYAASDVLYEVRKTDRATFEAILPGLS